MIKAMRPEGFDLLLMLAWCRQESGFNPNARSKAGAQGLFQIMPGTWSESVKELRIKNANPYNPLQNTLVGVYYLNKMIQMFGKLELALTAYNWGPGNMQRIIKLAGTNDLEILKVITWQVQQHNPETKELETVTKSMPKEAREYAQRIFNYYHDPATLEHMDDFIGFIQ